MRKFVTCIWCAALACAGYFLTSTSSDNVSQNTLYAATIPNWNNNGLFPLDLQLDEAKRNESKTVEIHDSIPVETIKYVKVPAPRNTTDTVYMPLYIPSPIDGVPVNNKNPGSKKSTVVLTVDGNIVYETDGLREP